ncbi:aromatic amino acid ammonia-lyase [Nostoc sp. CHAB 5784]|uniref:aromatic amino acid lyase n=1 Tax=Nostoc mirabile TaxID=2907820 RepID=UPI001E5939C2|nr:aromatic amino acid lyase [Nostoc mirabile]MCC5667954.1 aromatic amino acid ammonia-lyase [Nostoc mirabile CHAB5784]
MHITSTTKNTTSHSISGFVGNPSKTVTVDNHDLTIDEVVSVARYGVPICITDNHDALQGVQASCDYIHNAVETGAPIYGVTSGFGGMANVVISKESAALLQNNLTLFYYSHESIINY